MFTGIVLERGSLIADPAPSGQGGVRLRIACGEEVYNRLSIGASLAVSGVCLTIVELEPGAAAVELSPETLARTTLGTLGAGDAVNLEPALRAGDPLGGHWVQGHVDTTVRVLACRSLTEHSEMEVEPPAGLERYVVEKGSIALDGVSLTVARLLPDRFTVALIPHTLGVTTLGLRRPGERLNCEVDILAKYVENLLAARGLTAPPA